MAEDTTSVHWRFNDKDVIHPAKVKQYADKWGTPQEFWGKANSYTNPLGKEPGNLWLLMRRKDVYEMDATGTYSLTIVDTPNDQTVTAPGFSIVKAYSVVLAEAETDDAVYLVHAQDARGDMAYTSINEQYNVRHPAPNAFSGATLYYPESLNSGSIWTWQTMISDIWTNLPDSAGAAPTLPYTPHGTPEGFRFIGVSAWDALHVVLEKINCTTKYEPIGGAITIIRLGETSSTLAQTFVDLKPRLMYDADPLAGFFASSMPETIEVFFRRKDEYYGTESDTPRTGNWEMTPAYSKTVATGVSGAAAGSIFPVWDDLPALWSSTTGTWSNSATMDARAAEVASNLEDRIRREHERIARIYSGIVTSVTPSAEVSEVKWRHYGDSRAGTEVGTVTEVRNRPVDSGLTYVRAGMSFSEIEATTTENLLPPDFSRGTHPVYPRVSQMVKVVNTGSPAGYTVSANGNGLHPGKVYVIKGTTMTVQEDCWILFVDRFDTYAGAVSVVNHDFYIGRLYGAYSSGGTVYPLYVARAGSIQESIGYLFELTASLSLGGSAAAETLNCSYTKTGIPITVHDFEGEYSGPSGYKGACLFQPSCNTYEIVSMQRRARFVYGTLDTVIAVDGTAVVTVTGYWDGQNPGSTVTARNLQMTAASAEHLEKSDHVLCCWKDTVSQPTGEYVIIEHFEGWRWAKVVAQSGSQDGLLLPWNCTAVDTMAGAGADAPAVSIVVWIKTTYTPAVDDVIPYQLSEDSKFVCPWDGGSLKVKATCTYSPFALADNEVATASELHFLKHQGFEIHETGTKAMLYWKSPPDSRDASSPRDYLYVTKDPSDGTANWPVPATCAPIYGEFYATGKVNWTTKGANAAGYLCASSHGLTKNADGGSYSSDTQILKLRLSSGFTHSGTPGTKHDILFSNELTDGSSSSPKTGCGVTIRSVGSTAQEYQATHTPGIDTYDGNPTSGALVIKIKFTAFNQEAIITTEWNDGHLTTITGDETYAKITGGTSPRLHVSGAISYSPTCESYDFCP